MENSISPRPIENIKHQILMADVISDSYITYSNQAAGHILICPGAPIKKRKACFLEDRKDNKIIKLSKTLFVSDFDD